MRRRSYNTVLSFDGGAFLRGHMPVASVGRFCRCLKVGPPVGIEPEYAVEAVSACLLSSRIPVLWGRAVPCPIGWPSDLNLRGGGVFMRILVLTYIQSRVFQCLFSQLEAFGHVVSLQIAGMFLQMSAGLCWG